MKESSKLTYRVGTFRNVGLEAKWTKQFNGGPIIVARDPNAESEHQRTSWWSVDVKMFDLMKESGVREGFNQSTLLGDIFSIPA
jgi:hypothetical protein